MGKKSIETLVGLFVLLGMLGLVFLSLKAANLASFSSGDTYTLQADFDNIGGLKARAPVRSAGVTVGRVTSIALDAKTYQGVVTMEIDRKLQFPRDTAAKILTAGLLGDQYVGHHLETLGIQLVRLRLALGHRCTHRVCTGLVFAADAVGLDGLLVAIPRQTFHADGGDVAAVATEAFDERDLHTGPRGRERCGEAGRTRADDEYVGVVDDVDLAGRFGDRAQHPAASRGCCVHECGASRNRTLRQVTQPSSLMNSEMSTTTGMRPADRNNSSVRGQSDDISTWSSPSSTTTRSPWERTSTIRPAARASTL